MDRLVICDHATECPFADERHGDYCSGLKPHLRGYVLDQHCTDEHDCKGVKVKCVEVATPNKALSGFESKP